MNNIKFFFWKITHWNKYHKLKHKMFALQAEHLDKQEKFRLEIMKLAKKHKKIPPKYALQYMRMKKIKIPWYRDNKIIKKMKKTAKRMVKNEWLNSKSLKSQMRENAKQN